MGSGTPTTEPCTCGISALLHSFTAGTPLVLQLECPALSRDRIWSHLTVDEGCRNTSCLIIGTSTTGESKAHRSALPSIWYTALA